MPRFFVDAELGLGAIIALPPRVAHHAQHVLRLRAGESITIFNGRGGEFGARLLSATPAAARLESFDPVDRESPLKTTLVQALVSTEKLEWIIEKATEIGVNRLVIAPTARSNVKLAGSRVETRVARWREIAITACSQCGRNRLPTVEFVPQLSAAFTLGSDSAVKCIFAPTAEGGVQLQRSTTSITVAVGPEGDWSEEELSMAEKLGYVRALFGPRVLRTETAGVAIMAAVQAVAGDLGLSVA